MNVSLSPFEENDLLSLQMRAEEIKTQRYISRILPNKSNQYLNSQKSLLAWYVTQKGDQNVGVDWLEKEAIDDEIVVLGILIGKKDFLGQGIGEKAIKLAIRKSYDEISYKSVCVNVRALNKRTIRCYRKCGFVEVSRGNKIVDGIFVIPFITTELRLKQSPIHRE